MTDEVDGAVPGAVLEATRALLWAASPAAAARIVARLVRALGADLVPADTTDASAIPTDLSFGAGEPVLASAAPGTRARVLLDRYLPTVLLDARQALELSQRVDRLAEAASTDVLTGLPNRRMLERSLGRLTDSSTVIILDLDHFKDVNDRLGHAVGDEVLRAFGAALMATARARDTLGRYGGEEFVIVLPSTSDPESFLTRLRERWLILRPQPVTFTAGIAQSSGDATEVMARADAALYRAKEEGRDRWMWAEAGTSAPVTEPGDVVEPHLDDVLDTTVT